MNEYIFENDTISDIELFDYIYEKEYISPKYAYDMAQLSNILIDGDIYDIHNNIILTHDDLINISQYNPPVNYEQYIKIMSYSKNKIISMYPELKHIPKLDIFDMKYYVMDSYNKNKNTYNNEITPNLIKYSYYLTRAKIYYNLGDIGKSLFINIYSTIDKYIKCISPSPLEGLIIGLDQNIENIEILIALSERYGISINYIDLNNICLSYNNNLRICDITHSDILFSARTYMYSIIDEIIYKLYKYNIVNYNMNIMIYSSDNMIYTFTIQSIIDMNFSDYLKIYPNDTIESYDIRLIATANTFIDN